MFAPIPLRAWLPDWGVPPGNGHRAAYAGLALVSVVAEPEYVPEWKRTYPPLRLVPRMPARAPPVMTIGNPTVQGAGWAQKTTSGQTTYTSAAITPGASVLVVAVFQNAGGASDPGAPTSVKDNQGSPVSYQLDASIGVAANAGHLSVWSNYYVSAPGTITLTVAFPSSNYTNGFIYTIQNAASTSWLDTIGTSSSTSTTAMAVTTAGNCAQADSVGLGCYTRGSNIAAETTWPGAGFSSLTNLTNATRSAGLSIQYVNGVTSGATLTSPGTLSAATGLARAVVVYKGVSGGNIDTFTVATTDTDAPAFSLAGMSDTFALATSDVDTPTIKVAATRNIAMATADRDAPAFSLAGMSDTFTLASTDTDTVSFGVTVIPGPNTNVLVLREWSPWLSPGAKRWSHRDVVWFAPA